MAEDAELIEARDLGFLFSEIAVLMDSRSEGSCRARWQKLMAGTTKRQRAQHRTRARRSCLRCRRSFASAGPGNRLCAGCRVAVAEISPFEPD